MAADYLSLISAIPSLISDFSGNTTAPYKQQQQQLAQRQGQISAALTNGPSDPLYQSIYGQYKQQNANNAASLISEAQGQNRANANLGRTPLFSQERGSENIFRSLMQQQQNAGVQADQQTRASLTGGSQAALQGLAGYNSLTPSTIAANKQQNTGYTSIYDLLRGLNGTVGNTGSTGSSGGGSYGSLGTGGYNTNYNPTASFMQSQPSAPNYSGFSY